MPGQGGKLRDLLEWNEVLNTPTSSIWVFRNGATSKTVLLALSQVSCVECAEGNGASMPCRFDKVLCAWKMNPPPVRTSMCAVVTRKLLVRWDSDDDFICGSQEDRKLIVSFFAGYGSLWLEMVGLEVVGVWWVPDCDGKTTTIAHVRQQPITGALTFSSSCLDGSVTRVFGRAKSRIFFQKKQTKARTSNL